MNNGNNVPRLQMPGQVRVEFHEMDGELASPAVTTLGMQSGVTVFAKGGMTKRQAIAAQLIPQFVNLGYTDRTEAVAEALEWADELLSQTAPPAEPQAQ